MAAQRQGSFEICGHSATGGGTLVGVIVTSGDSQSESEFALAPLIEAEAVAVADSPALTASKETPCSAASAALMMRHILKGCVFLHRPLSFCERTTLTLHFAGVTCDAHAQCKRPTALAIASAGHWHVIVQLHSHTHAHMCTPVKLTTVRSARTACSCCALQLNSQTPLCWPMLCTTKLTYWASSDEHPLFGCILRSRHTRDQCLSAGVQRLSGNNVV